MTKITCDCPFFPGFYESIYYSSDDAFYETQEEIRYWRDECGVELEDDDIDFDYRQRELDMCEAHAKAFYERTPDFILNVKFVEMHSPKQYNYSTDRAIVEIEFDDDYLSYFESFITNNREWLAAKIEKDWSSRSGFISFIDNNIDDFVSHLYNPEDKDFELYMEIMLTYYMARTYELENPRGEGISWEIQYNVYENHSLCLYRTFSDRAKELIKNAE